MGQENAQAHHVQREQLQTVLRLEDHEQQYAQIYGDDGVVKHAGAYVVVISLPHIMDHAD